jgi:putative nucleotidyltransferase with HDIG domain
VRYATAALATFVIAHFFPFSSIVEYSYEDGSIWPGETLRAPFAYPLYKDEQTYNRDVEKAMGDVLRIYVPTGVNEITIYDSLKTISEAIALSEKLPPILSERSRLYIGSIPQEGRLPMMTEITSALYEGLTGPYRAGVIDQSRSSIRSEKITIRRSDVYEEDVPVAMVYDSLGVLHTVEAAISKKLSPDEAFLAMDLYYDLYRPSLRYSAPLTEEVRQNARESVPQSMGIVAEGELIVSTGERITETTKLKLASLQRSRRLRDVEESPWLQLIGNLAHSSILIGLSLIYLFYYRRRIFYDNMQIGIILSLMVLLALLSWLSLDVNPGLPLEFLIPLPLISMLLVILFDSRSAFYLTVTCSFIVAGIRGADYGMAIACLSAGVLAIYAVRDIKSRTQLFRSIAFSMLGYTLAILALGLGRGESTGEVEMKLVFAAINATISPVLTFGMIMLLENVFGIATDLKLLEYDNLNHPLLRALADKAPGTYQHTLTIALLAESAATAVNANALLAKVGAYFHDVGKIAKAEYFVENQMGMGNKHDKIKPEMSAKIIRNHVFDGIELAREYKLPQRIIDFIPMHHGTTMIQYFYDKAKETNPDVDPKGYTYPGPLPLTREAAIVMLADAVEATTRALPDPNRKAIEGTVDTVIKKRFSEGQLDQCELTLADLTKIKMAFVKNLIGMSHPRIQYKTGAEKKEPESPAPTTFRRAKKEDPVIPYIDDAFGNIDTELSYRRGNKPDGEGDASKKD